MSLLFENVKSNERLVSQLLSSKKKLNYTLIHLEVCYNTVFYTHLYYTVSILLTNDIEKQGKFYL